MQSLQAISLHQFVTEDKRQDAEKDGADEVAKYMSDTSSERSSLNAYPMIKQLYVQLNTTLPASAAVERLFSLGGRLFSPLRSKMLNDHFEMLAFFVFSKMVLNCDRLVSVYSTGSRDRE